jgi:ubiquinone/menaquinone biosynthesis C-methylase UbiE
VYVEADVAQLPFRDGAFATAHSSNGFHLFPSPSLAAQELARVTRPEGRVAVTTWTDQGHLVARRYGRLLARLGHIEAPRSPATFLAMLDAVGMRTEESTVTGTLLRWQGRT